MGCRSEKTDDFIGDCGLTIQNIDGDLLPEIGYHIHKLYWRRGFGSEAARAVRDWAFEHAEYDCLYSYMKYTNIGSYSTAIATGMKMIKEYPDEKKEISYAYAITRKEWSMLKRQIRFIGASSNVRASIDPCSAHLSPWSAACWGCLKPAFDRRPAPVLWCSCITIISENNLIK